MDRIVVDRITKTYVEGKGKSRKETTALRGVSFSCAEGEIFGLIGPDGAGKTTLFRILTTLILPDGGKARIDGLDIVQDFREIRKRVGYMPGRFSLYQDLTVEENMNLFASIFHPTVEENYHLVKEIYQQIEPFKDRRAGQLSGGMKQKLALSCALIHQPRVLLLDEPTTGVDAVSRKEFWDMLDRLKAQGLTILVSTPYMDEAARCDKVGLIQDGQLFSLDTPQGICDEFTDPLWAVAGPAMYELLQALRRSELVRTAFAFGDSHHVTLADPTREAETALLRWLADQGHPDLQWKRISPTIEDRFMAFSTESHA